AGSDPITPDADYFEADHGGLTPQSPPDELPFDEPALHDPPMSDEPFARPDGPKFVRAQNLIHEHLAPNIDPDFEWSDPVPSSERDSDREPRFKLPEREPGIASHFGSSQPDEPEPEVRILRAVPDESPVNALIADSDNHRKEVASRVSFLFPRPETTEWSVRDVGYDRTRRAQVDEPD
ncbi:MAG TPA: hypothetical protein VD766_12980, partial [Solirubrobacterales bacterium]|nr:hypothetical protein [Solirubrobacterales bacterium]